MCFIKFQHLVVTLQSCQSICSYTFGISYLAGLACSSVRLADFPSPRPRPMVLKYAIILHKVASIIQAVGGGSNSGLSARLSCPQDIIIIIARSICDLVIASSPRGSTFFVTLSSYPSHPLSQAAHLSFLRAESSALHTH